MPDQTKLVNWCILDHPELLKQICEKYNISEGKLRNDIEQFEKDVNDFEARRLAAITESSSPRRLNRDLRNNNE